jgi:hypothetical protein
VSYIEKTLLPLDSIMIDKINDCLRLACVIIDACYEDEDRIGHTPPDLPGIFELRDTLQQLLEVMQGEVASGPSSLAIQEQLNAPDGPLVHCKSKLTNLQICLSRQSRRKRVREGSEGSLEESDLMSILDGLTTTTVELNCVLQSNQGYALFSRHRSIL